MRIKTVFLGDTSTAQINSDNDDNAEQDQNLEDNNKPKRSKRARSKSSDDDPNKRAKLGDPFASEEGTIVFNNSSVKIKAKSIAHKRFTRFSLNDHLYNLTIKNLSGGNEPLVINITKAIKEALKNVLDRLKTVYGKDLHHQVYVTIIENKILKGLNSGNYDINTPSEIIANRVLSMLYNYLKSFQTLRINPSFKIQVKVLSVPHMAYLENSKRAKRLSYKKKIYSRRG